MAETLKRRRAACRGWVNRATDSVRELLDRPTPTVTTVALNDVIDEFDKRLAALDDVQSECELAIEDEDALMSDIEHAATFRDKARQVRVCAAEKLAELTQAGPAMSAASASVSSVDAKLPKLKLPSFSGDVLEWDSFWDQFEATIHHSDLPTVTKFSYLRSLLEGEAKQAIQGLSMTTPHYESACKILKDRYGRKERLIFTHIQKLLHMSVPVKCPVSALWKLNDDLQAHTRSLESLGIEGTQYGVILTPLILSRLPQDIRMEWSREGEGHESDLAYLLTFLEKEIQRRERSQVFKESLAPEEKSRKPDTPKHSTASALQTVSSASKPPCGICKKPHPTDRCFRLTRVPVKERREKVSAAGLCFRCLLPGHIARGCGAYCTGCKGRHHALLCNPDNHVPSKPQSSAQAAVERDSPKEEPQEANAASLNVASSESPGTNLAARSRNTRVLLQTARVKVRGQGIAEATIMFNTGSDRSYITQNLVHKIRPEWSSSESVSYATFGAGKPRKSELLNVFNVLLQENGGSEHSILATEVPVICAPLVRPEVPREILDSLGDLQFANLDLDCQQVNVDILIGLDHYWKFVGAQVISSVPSGLMAQSSVFGWILSGTVPDGHSVAGDVVSHQLVCINTGPGHGIQSFWNLESIGIVDDEDDSGIDPVLQQFQQDLRKVDGRYEVSLPWKSGFQERLQDNEKLAQIRLGHLNKKLDQDVELKSQYNSVIKEMLSSDIIEQVPEKQKVKGPVFYMPHRPVVRATATSTKVRPVFDASSKGYNGVALNDCMHVGPCLLGNLTEILLRFRRWKVAITADVEKAFLQISVREQDRDVHRFLWDVDGEVQTMRFRRVPFGNCASPFLLNATVQSHLSTYPPSRAICELQDNLYVDDLLSGADSEADGCSLVGEASSVMADASMNLTKWCSNSTTVGDVVVREFHDKVLDSEAIKVLGMCWLAGPDCFTFQGATLAPDLCVTKRLVLSFFSKLFDPLGFSAPFVMMAKCLFKELWALNLSWDDEVPSEFQTRFMQWVQDLQVLRQWEIPRCYTGVGWSDVSEIQLHGFGDASPKGYGACIYLTAVTSGGNRVSSLVMAKAKVAPMKTKTLPRLELLGCVLCARLIVFVSKALKLPDDVELSCWTDSMIALAWIKSEPGRWKTFVANRVIEIQKLTTPERWSHCAGQENPADLVTRGISADELVNSRLWLAGPSFLLDDTERVHQDDPVCDFNIDALCVADYVDTALVAVTDAPQEVFAVERWGTLTKALRVVAWTLRFIGNIRKAQSDRVTGNLSFDELQVAKRTLIQSVQRQEFHGELQALKQELPLPKGSSLCKLSPFVASDGLLRVQGRLQHSALSYGEKHPVILPKCHLSLLFVRFHHMLMKHAGIATVLVSLRNEFWVIGARRMAKRVIKECVPCQRQNAPASRQQMPPLPRLRVNQAVPFAVTGIDHAGPMYCCNFPGKKFWVLLCTCAVTRAVHLELVESLSTPETVLALRRLAARRGLPQVIYSDNARGFKACPDQLQKQFGHPAPEWRFIAPRSPWWGGWWERLIRSVKSSLRKTVGSSCLTRAELETTLHEVESCINSRPLTFVSDDLEGEQPLTPSHFLLGHGGGFYRAPSVNPVSSGEDLSLRYELRRSILDDFWAIWSSEYIRNLPPWKGVEGSSRLQVGSVVLLQDDLKPRLQWPLGVITQVFQSTDGVVRTVEVKTASSKVIRSVPRVHDLEILSNDSFSSVPSRAPPCIMPDAPSTADNRVSTAPPVDKDATDCIERPGSVPYVTRRGRTVRPRQRLDL